MKEGCISPNQTTNKEEEIKLKNTRQIIKQIKMNVNSIEDVKINNIVLKT